MSDIKYYEPTIEEFHVGFEYHYKDLNLNLKDYGWFPETVSIEGFNCEFYIKQIASGDYCVKYLDQEDIESLGFKLTQYEGIKFKEYKKLVSTGNDNFLCTITHNYTSKMVIIKRTGVEIFTGTIKNISELKKLMQQLNIKL
jgi:hypothetical protein